MSFDELWEKACLNGIPPSKDAALFIYNQLTNESSASSITEVVQVPRESLAELIGAVRTINRGKSHQIRVPGDDEPCYWQRKEWVDWAIGAAEELSNQVELLNGQSPMPTKTDFTQAELLEIEQALEAHESDDPEFKAVIASACLKIGLALKRPWALKKQAEGA